jgi:hypothetical protein
LKAAKERLIRETLDGAMRSAERLITEQMTATDEERIAKNALELIASTPINAGGGRA